MAGAVQAEEEHHLLVVVVAAAEGSRLARQPEEVVVAAAAAHLRMVVVEEERLGHWLEVTEAGEAHSLPAKAVEAALRQLVVVVQRGRWRLVREEVLPDFSLAGSEVVAKSEEEEVARPSQVFLEGVAAVVRAG